ncbi:unnamed protein product [Ectocarpus sp. 12 AP-2014]
MYFGAVPRRWAHRRRLRAVFDPRCEVLTMAVNLARRSAGSNLDESLNPFSVDWHKGKDKASQLRAANYDSEGAEKNETTAEPGGEDRGNKRRKMQFEGTTAAAESRKEMAEHASDVCVD